MNVPYFYCHQLDDPDNRMAVIYKLFAYVKFLYLCICSIKNESLLTPIIPTSQIIIYAGLFTIVYS